MKKVGKVLPSQLYWCIYWCMQQFLNWKEETSTKFSLSYTKSFLCLCLLHWKKKKHFRIPLSVSQHICDKLKKNTKYVIFQSFSQHLDKRNKGKLHFTILNYALCYTLYLKLFERTLYTLNYHTNHTLHPAVTFAVTFNGMLLHMTRTYILFRWNKLKKPKHPSSKSIKIEPNFFHISLLVSHACNLFSKFRFL